jgi:hypothetical protein
VGLAVADAGIVGRTAVGAVLLVSGVAKVPSRSWPAQARAFGLPRPLAGALPWAEVGLGALVAAQVGGWPVDGAALVLLAAFTAAVTRRVAAGDAPPCACFGDVSSRPASWRTVGRNAVVCGLAALGLAAGPPHLAAVVIGVAVAALVVAAELSVA